MQDHLTYMKSQYTYKKNEQANSQKSERTLIKEELAQEKKRYMDVSGLVAIQEREASMPPVNQKDVKIEIESGLEKLPQYAERANQLNLKTLKK